MWWVPATVSSLALVLAAIGRQSAGRNLFVFREPELHVTQPAILERHTQPTVTIQSVEPSQLQCLFYSLVFFGRTKCTPACRRRSPCVFLIFRAPCGATDSPINPGDPPSTGRSCTSPLPDLLAHVGTFWSRPSYCSRLLYRTRFASTSIAPPPVLSVSTFILCLEFIRSTTAWEFLRATSTVGCRAYKVGLLCHRTHSGLTLSLTLVSQRHFPWVLFERFT